VIVIGDWTSGAQDRPRGTPKRIDASRNHDLVLAAVERLLRTAPVESVTMDAVAQDAGVGKGTVFRRFGSREGLLGDVLARRTRSWLAELTERTLPEPDPRRRLELFGPAHMRFVVDHADLTVAAGAEGWSVADDAVRDHVSGLLAELGQPEEDREFWVGVLLVASSTGLLRFLATRGADLDDAERGWHDLIARLWSGCTPPPRT
jgi:AcrR family transcriptional regulator